MMLGSYKNIWSLNTEEAIVAGILRSQTKKEIEAFIPLNAQMKDIDLVLINTKNSKIKTIQVKGSRAYEGNKTQIEKYGYGSYSWIDIKKNIIDNSITDYYIFLIYTLEQFNDKKKGKVYVRHHTITISAKEFKEKVQKYKLVGKGGICRFQIWINPKTKQAFDFRNLKDSSKEEDYSKFLDEKGLYELNKELLNNKK